MGLCAFSLEEDALSEGSLGFRQIIEVFVIIM